MSSRLGHSRDREIPVGQRFQAAGGATWEYAGPAPTQGPEPHARLIKPGDPRTIKIISLSALLDRSLFVRVD